MLTTVGLTSKNAILIIAFATENLAKGMELVEATMLAVRDRLRPILMTSLAFGFGVLPLALATGAGSGAQRAIGTGVFGGMMVGTLLGIFFIPLFFVVVERLIVRRRAHRASQATAVAGGKGRGATRMRKAPATAGCSPPHWAPARAACWNRAARGRSRDRRGVAVALDDLRRPRGHCRSRQTLAAAAADIGWRDFFTDPTLEALIEQALANNRDLRVAVLNVERARALYRVATRGARAGRGRDGFDGAGGRRGRTTETFTAGVGVTGYELDLFGRVRNLNESALQRYFAQEETRRSAQLSLIAEVANAYLTLAADQEQVRLARATLDTREKSFAITSKRHELGAVSGLDLSQSRTLVESARAELARYSGRVAQDSNALSLLVGAPFEPDLQPEGLSAIR